MTGWDHQLRHRAEGGTPSAVFEENLVRLTEIQSKTHKKYRLGFVSAANGKRDTIGLPQRDVLYRR